MPLSPVHKTKRSKNLAILALVVGWCALIFVVSIIRMKGG